MIKLMDKRAVASIGEYILTFTLVFLIIGSMAVYIQRALQARMRDTRHYAMTEFRKGCTDAINCVGAGKIAEQYEPYYSQVGIDNARNNVRQAGVSGRQTISSSKLESLSNVLMNQLPPKEAVNQVLLGVQ